MHDTGQCEICKAGSIDENMHCLGTGEMCKAVGPPLPSGREHDRLPNTWAILYTAGQTCEDSGHNEIALRLAFWPPTPCQ